MTTGARRSGISKFGPLIRAIPGHKAEPGREAEGDHGHDYTGRHVSPRGKTARKRVGKVVPAAAAAATLAAGAAAYTIFGAGHPQAAQLNDAMIQGTVSSSAKIGAAKANAAMPVKTATVHATAKTSAKPAMTTAKPSAAKSTASASPAAAATPAASTPAAAAQAAIAQAANAPASQAPAASTLSCNLSDGLLPENVTAIVSFLLANGYSDNAAAGIAGNIYQESKGDPESVGMGGGGLIGFTPLPSGYVTGDVSADLQTQLNAVLTYNQTWASYIPELNAAASPSDAAYIYVTDFERAGIPAASTREASAEDVAQACGI